MNTYAYIRIYLCLHSLMDTEGERVCANVGPSRPHKTTQVIHRQPSITSYPQFALLWFISAPMWGIMHHNKT